MVRYNKKGGREMNKLVRFEVNRNIADLLIAQSNLILDVIEGKVNIIDATNIYYSNISDLDKLRERLRKIRKKIRI